MKIDHKSVTSDHNGKLREWNFDTKKKDRNKLINFHSIKDLLFIKKYN